jgi:D-arabinose 5-phosphate isomerase GutQ
MRRAATETAAGAFFGPPELKSCETSILPMGSLFEAAQMIFFEIAVLKLRPLLHQSAETMRARHTNLE